METQIRYEVFKEFYNKFNNTLKKDDAIQILTEYLEKAESEHEKQLIRSLTNKDLFIKKIDDFDFITYLKLIDSLPEQCVSLCNTIKSITNDTVQLNTLNRIIKTKQLQQSFDKPVRTIKACPHCGEFNIGDTNSYYTICGYPKKGLSDTGCGNDWCFKCGKKLCKSWNYDELFNKSNRIHDSICCKKNAQIKKHRYPDEYCMCTNNCVSR